MISFRIINSKVINSRVNYMPFPTEGQQLFRLAAAKTLKSRPKSDLFDRGWCIMESTCHKEEGNVPSDEL